MLGSVAGQMLVIYTPLFQSIFKTEALSLLDLVYLSALASSTLFLSEAFKFYKYRSRQASKHIRRMGQSMSSLFSHSTSKDETHMV